MELFIVLVIVGLAIAYVAKSFYHKYQSGKQGGAGCHCTSCDMGTLRCEANKGESTGSVT